MTHPQALWVNYPSQLLNTKNWAMAKILEVSDPSPKIVGILLHSLAYSLPRWH